MKKRLPVLVIAMYCMTVTHAQDYGYKTIDVGGEYQWYPEGYIAALHLAYNFPIHQSIQVRAGYNKSSWNSNGKHTFESGGGPDLSLGYRYYFQVRPHGLFLGARVDVSRQTINWSQGIAAGLGTTTGQSKTWTILPAAELGYMILINDEFFITPSIAGGVQSNIKTEGQPVGEGAVFLAGMSVGWKF